MKKIGKSLWLLAATIMMLLPGIVFAEESQTGGDPSKALATNLQQACNEEDIPLEDEYTYAEDKVNLYLFRGNGCSHCHDFLAYLASNIADYGKYINVITYETWSNQDNVALMEAVAQNLGEEIGGVPFIVIGDQTFSGYSSEMNETLEKLMKEQYESEQRYDVLKELGIEVSYDSNVDEATFTDNDKNSSDIIVLIVALIVIGGIVAVVIIARKQN